MKNNRITENINSAKQELNTLKVLGNYVDSKWVDTEIKALEEKIHHLERQETTLLNPETQRVADIFFVITLDNNIVQYDDQGNIIYDQQTAAEKLQIAAEHAEHALKWINKSIEDLYKKIYNKKVEEIRKSESYYAAIKKYQDLWLSLEEAKKLAEEQLWKIAQTLTVREIVKQAQLSKTQWSNTQLWNIDYDLAEKILNNESIKAFTKIYDEIILVAEDLTDHNHLDRELPVPYDPYFDLVTTYYLNKQGTIEAYLFDTPSRDPEKIYTRDQRTEKEQNHLLKHIFNKKEASSDKKNTSDEKKQQQEKKDDKKNLEELSHEMNTFSSKRIRQLVMYHNFTYMRKLLSEQGSWISLQDAIDFDFSNIDINEQHNFTIPISYGGIKTTIRIDKEGTVRMEGLDEKIRTGGKSDIELSSGIWNITEKLTDAAHLDPDQLMQCTSRSDIYEAITNNLSSSLLSQQSFSHLVPKKIAQTIEHQSLLGDLRGYLDNQHTRKNPAQITARPNIKNTDSFTTFITHITKGGEGKRALNIEETREISNYLSSQAMKDFFALLSKEPYLFEEFLWDSGVLSISPDQRPSKLREIFNALHQMATSEVKPAEENWLTLLQKLTGDATPPLVGTMGSGAKYIYQDKKLTLAKNWWET
jgi:hypothetical protein